MRGSENQDEFIKWIKKNKTEEYECVILDGIFDYSFGFNDMREAFEAGQSNNLLSTKENFVIFSGIIEEDLTLDIYFKDDFKDLKTLFVITINNVSYHFMSSEKVWKVKQGDFVTVKGVPNNWPCDIIIEDVIIRD